MMQPTELMQKPKIIDKQDLEICAHDIAEKYQNGSMPDLKQTGWTAAWKYLIKELRSCCPGFSDIEYGIALNQAFVDSK
jgi:hypothetical protein